MAQRRPQSQIKWHRFLAKGFELSVGQKGVLVFAEIEVTQNPPKVDVLLLRRDSDEWTAEQLALLPDGIRDSNASHVLIEFKYSESLTLDAIRQAVSYEYFYRVANELAVDEVKMFLLCAKTPSTEHLRDFGYTSSHLAGVYKNQHKLVEHIPLLVLNGLSDEPHNAFVKAFASRSTQKAKAFARIREQTQLSDELITYFEVLRTLWSLPEGATMNELLTPERVLEIGQEWKRILLSNLPPEELDTYINPEYKHALLNSGREEGREEGESALCNTLEQILQRRLGIVPPAVSERLRQCSLSELNSLVNAALDAATWAEFTEIMPNPTR